MNTDVQMMTIQKQKNFEFLETKSRLTRGFVIQWNQDARAFTTRDHGIATDGHEMAAMMDFPKFTKSVSSIGTY